MKHNWRVSLQLLGWVLVAVLFALWLFPYVKDLRGGGPQAPWYVLLPVIVVVMAISFWAWMKVVKRNAIKVTRYVFAITLGVIISRVISSLFIESYVQNIYALFALRLVICTAIGLAFFYTTQQMLVDWKWTVRLYSLSNLFMALGVGLAAIIVSYGVSVWLAVLLLFLASLYDMWAVWKSRSMVKMATFFANGRVFPGVVVPKGRGKFGMIGGGDIFFIIFVAVTMKSAALMWWFGLSMFAGLCMLMLFSRPKKFYPALPFIFLGLMLGGFAALVSGVLG